MDELEVLDGRGNKNILALPKPKKYRKIRIERLGNKALKIVLDGVKLGRSYTHIAEVLSETFNKEINYKDVSKVMIRNAKIMLKYKDDLNKEQLERANLVLNEATVIVEDMGRLGKIFFSFEEKLKQNVPAKDLIELSRAMTDLSRTRASLIQNFKKLTGQYQERPLINIDQRKQEISIHTDKEGSSKLVKELAKAQFRTPKPIEEKSKEKKDIVEAEFKVEQEKAEENN